MDRRLEAAAQSTPGFMPEAEGLALYQAGLAAGRIGPLLEIGSYCGRSAIYLGAAARTTGTNLYSVDHHRGSEEHQPGEAYHDPRWFDAKAARVDTLPHFAAAIRKAGLADVVLGIAARSRELAATWSLPLGLVFLDGGHSSEAAEADFTGWSPHVLPGGSLCIHDVFPDPDEGGRPPFEIYQRALASSLFEERAAIGSLRVLTRLES